MKQIQSHRNSEKMSAKIKKNRFEGIERERLPQLALRYRPKGEK
jgi:hypothetical protein